MRRGELMGVRPIHAVQRPPFAVAHYCGPTSPVIVSAPEPFHRPIRKHVTEEQLARVHTPNESKLQIGSRRSWSGNRNAVLVERVVAEEFALRFSDRFLILVSVSAFFSGRAANASVVERALGEEAGLAPIVFNHSHVE